MSCKLLAISDFPENRDNERIFDTELFWFNSRGPLKTFLNLTILVKTHIAMGDNICILHVTTLNLERQVTKAQRQERQNIRNCYLVASEQEANQGIRIHLKEKNFFAAACIVELLQEDYDMYKHLKSSEVDAIEIQLTNVIGGQYV